MNIIEQSDIIRLDEFMQRPLFAHLATSSINGARESPIWCLWKNKEIWICTDIETDTFCHRIQEDDRCAIGIVDYDLNQVNYIMWDLSYSL